MNTSLIKGKGTPIEGNKSLKNRAKRKVISQTMTLNLIDVVKQKGDTDRLQAYWNTYHCQNKLISHDGNLHGNYCKNRFCTLCLSIRKAEIINRYYPELKKWEDPHFVTLTVKAVSAKNLKKWIKGMKRAFKLISDRCKKRHQRGKGIKLTGIKSLECNFNPKKKTYNPHYHLIVANKEIANILKNEWLKQWTPKHSYHKAQHIRKVENMERDLIETIKYGSKIFTEPDINKNTQNAFPQKIYAKALDTIFTALKNIRVFERFGFNLPQQQNNKTESKLITNYQEWIFDPYSHDWINTNNEQPLTSFSIKPELDYILNKYIDKEVS